MSPPSKAIEHFKPWIGDNYASQGYLGKRVLILGESHYEWLDDQSLASDWTQQFIENGFSGKMHRFRTRVAAVVLGRRPTADDDTRSFWHSIAFANYIPVSVGKGANARPTEAMWEEAVPRFAELITTHRPDFLLVLGHPLWMRMHYTFTMNGHLERHPNDVNEYRIWRYQYESGKTMLACAINHPSRSFNFKKWHPFVSAMLKAA